MQRVLLFCSALICLFGFAMASVQPAYGYVDPGSGLLALQALGATLSAIGFYFRHQIRRLFGRRKQPAARVKLPSAMAPEAESQPDFLDEAEAVAMSHSGGHELR